MTAEIRPARTADAAQIALVHVRSWQSAYRGLVPQEYLDSLDPVQRLAGWERILAKLDPVSDGVLVAGEANRLQGFVAYCPSRDDDTDPTDTGEVTVLYLLPGAWGQGTGRRLMAAAVDGLTAAGYDHAILWVLDSNARARRFYHAAGWSPDGSAKDEDIGGAAVTELRYRRSLPRPSPRPDRFAFSTPDSARQTQRAKGVSGGPR
jgi:ribosomal protein S18 acetylase RimI-like enzyme